MRFYSNSNVWTAVASNLFPFLAYIGGVLQKFCHSVSSSRARKFKFSGDFTLVVAIYFVKFRLVTLVTKKEMASQIKVTFQYLTKNLVQKL